MSTETKRREVLQMLADGSITAGEAGDLLLQINAEQAQPAAPAPPTAPEPPQPESEEPGTLRVKKARWFNVRVTDTDSGRDRVSLRIPLSVARIGLRMGARFSPEIDGLDWEQLLQELTGNGEQTIVEVNDEDDGEFVRIFVS